MLTWQGQCATLAHSQIRKWNNLKCKEKIAWIKKKQQLTNKLIKKSFP